VYGGPFFNGISGVISRTFVAGWTGVDLFFVLSGFLITRILLESRESDHYFRNFYARRVLRIMPLYYGYLAAVFLLGSFLPRFHINGAGSRSLLLYYYNFYAALSGGPLPFVHQFWSLSVEEHFYLLWPLIVKLLPNRTLLRICMFGAALALVLRIAVISSGAWFQVAYLTTPCRIDGLLGGAAVAIVSTDPEIWQRLSRYAVSAMVGGGALAIGIGIGGRHFSDLMDFRYVQGTPTDSSVVLTLGISAISLCFAAAIFLVVDGSFPQFLAGPRLRSVGKYSYAIYVFHSPLEHVALKCVVTFVKRESINPILGIVAVAAVTFILSFALAWISYHAFERHFLRLKDHFRDGPTGAAKARDNALRQAG
jgi:peptidoglycan/LPS O-acetylase OafA/YrhL